jgi:FKBP-type peptidyl-prolyl cis-trans isomerase FklB
MRARSTRRCAGLQDKRKTTSAGQKISNRYSENQIGKRIKDMLGRKQILTMGFVLLTAFAATAQDAPAAKPDTKIDKDKFSYALGMQFGESFKKQSLDLDPATFGKAFADAYNGGQLTMTEDEMKAVLTAASQEFKKKQMAMAAEKGTAAQKDGEKFLADNKTKEGVVTLPSGLQYKILKAGTGEKPTAADTVTCNYRGTLIDGKEFDASEKHGGPASFGVSQVIAGWTEALQLMPVGSKWQLFVPSNLGYGAQGPPDIGPNATLIFEVELVSIQKAPEGSK